MNWSDLENELDQWAREGKTVTLWWRDDDGGDWTPALEALLRLSNAHGVAVAMAVIPRQATPALADAIRGSDLVVVHQHGFRHRNYRRSNGKASEYPSHRARGEVGTELAAGRERLRELFADQAASILVPPWGHIAESLLESLPDWGYRGLSRFDPRDGAVIPGLVQVNAHCDLIKWRPAPHFRGEAKCLWHLTTHLAGRRRGCMDPTEPTGVLTHAEDLDADCHAFLGRLLEFTVGHPAARWLHPTELFPPPPETVAATENAT